MAVAVLMLMMLFGTGLVCRAEDRQVHLKAEHIAYDYEKKIVTADGKVLINYRDLKVTASHVVIAVDEDQLEADGDILVERGDEQYRGDHLSYDLKADKGILQPLNMELKTADMKEPLYGHGEQVKIEGDNNIIYRGTFTTCDLEDPHYHFSAGELDYFPGDRLVFYNAVYYEGHVPLMYWPYLYISLKDDDSNFLMPVVGQDGTMGWFLILGYKFYFSDRWKGIAYFDWMSILGRRYRFQQTYELGGKDKLTTEFALLDNKVTDNNEMSYTLQLDKYLAQDWDLTVDYKWLQTTLYDHDLPTSNLADNFYFMTVLKKTSGNPYLRFIFNDTQDSRYLSLEPRISWKPFKNGTLSISGTWSDVVAKTLNAQNDSYSLNLGYNQKLTDHLNLNLNHQFSSYGKSATDILAFKSSNWDWGWFAHTQFTSDITYKLNQFSYSQTGYKWGSTLQATSAPIFENKNKDFTINMGWSLKGQLYYDDYNMNDSEGFVFGRQLAADASVNANKTFSKTLSGYAGFKWTQVTADNIENFSGLTETITPGLSTAYGLTYNNIEHRFNASYRGAYNLSNNLWEPQTVTASWYPNQESSMQFNLNYNPIYDDLSTGLSLSYRPDKDTYIRADYNYSLQYTDTFYIQADIKRTFAQLWTAELHTQYNVFNQYVNTASISISYDWHCRTIKFSYDVTRDQYLLEMIFDAFPTAPIGLSNQQDFFWNWYNEVSK